MIDRCLLLEKIAGESRARDDVVGALVQGQVLDVLYPSAKSSKRSAYENNDASSRTTNTCSQSHSRAAVSTRLPERERIGIQNDAADLLSWPALLTEFVAIAFHCDGTVLHQHHELRNFDERVKAPAAEELDVMWRGI